MVSSVLIQRFLGISRTLFKMIRALSRLWIGLLTSSSDSASSEIRVPIILQSESGTMGRGSPSHREVQSRCDHTYGDWFGRPTVYRPLPRELQPRLPERRKRLGGVLLIFRKDLLVQRVHCEVPNVYAADIKNERTCRITGVYAPKSKSGNWEALSGLTAESCIVLGDFSIDLECRKDETLANELLGWAEARALTSMTADRPASVRSERTIGYALARRILSTLQLCAD